MTVKTSFIMTGGEKGVLLAEAARMVHSQVLKIRVEDSLIGQEGHKGAPLLGQELLLKARRRKAGGDFVFVAPRPALRSSPLGGKAIANPFP